MPLPDTMFELLGELTEKSIELDELLESAASFPHVVQDVRIATQATIRVGVACDKAFSFYYEDNFDALRDAGAEIIEFSPLRDPCLPDGLDALYFGGGYPELFASELAANRSMLTSVARFAEKGSPIYAECGGLMFLGKEILTREGAAFPMAGVLPLRVQMTERLVNFGYTEVAFTSDCLIGCAGGKARGHSFHCSKIVDTGPLGHAYRTRHSMTSREESEGFYAGNVLASYIHLHFLSAPGMAERFVASAKRARRPRPASEAAGLHPMHVNESEKTA